jgi:ABC-2 type transport system permease protein
VSALFRRGPAAPPSDTVPPDGFGLRALVAAADAMSVVAGWMGADRGAFLAILRAKLRLDLRVGGLRNPNKPAATGLLVTCAIDHLFGWFMVLAMAMLKDARVGAALSCGMMMVMVSMAVVSDLVDLLLAPADVSVLAARPVSPRTLMLARTGHAVLYTGLLAGSFLLPGWIAGAFLFSPAWLLSYAAAGALAALTVLLGITATFALLLRLTHPERVRNVVLIAQISASLVTFGGYYLCFGLLEVPGVKDWLHDEHALQLLLPPYWFASLADASHAADSPLRLAELVLALAVPALLGLAVMRLAGGDLLQRLAALDEGGGPPVSDQPGPLRRLGRRLVPPGLQRAGFDLFLGLAARERQFRQRVYPMLVMPLIMMVYFSFQAHRHHDSGGEQGWLMCGYLPVIYSISILQIVRFSDTPKAAWIYAVAPVGQYGELVCGAVKALCFAFLLPWYLILFTITGLFFGGLQPLDTLFAMLAVLAFTLWAARRLCADALPFTRTFRTAGSSGLQMLMFVLIVPLIGLLALAHFVLGDKPWAVALLAVGAAVMVVVNTRRLRTLQLPASRLVEES